MFSTTLLAAVVIAALPLAVAQTLTNETILGVYMFHRHGDRTPKSLPPANLTALGYSQIYASGQYYRGRYIARDATHRVKGINADVVKQSQIAVSAPLDTVLQNSATGFLQGLYPPVGSSLDTETLRNGTVVTSPMQGYQLIPVELVTTGGGSEDNAWLQSASGCAQATISSNEFFQSAQYVDLLNKTKDFYQGLTNTTIGVFNQTQMTFKNAYTIYDLLNVAEIHNSSIPSSSLLNPEVLLQLRTLADAHEWGLAYNSSDTMRAISGKTLAAQIVQFLNSTLNSKGAQKINIQFGAYASFMSFLGLAIPDIPQVNPDFYGVVDYASAMAFELFTNASTAISPTSYPTADEVYVRFVFHNGTASNTSQPAVYPLFGSGQPALAWSEFASSMEQFAVGTTQEWCTACGNFTGTCAPFAPATSTGSDSSGTNLSAGGDGGNGLSAVVNGVIGAMVMLAVVLGLEALVMVAFGLRVARRNKLVASGAVGGTGEVKAQR